MKLFYVIKRLFGEHITSRQIKMQNRELIFRCITYNLHIHVKLVIIRIFSAQLYLCNHLYMNTNSLLYQLNIGKTYFETNGFMVI